MDQIPTDTSSLRLENGYNFHEHLHLHVVAPVQPYTRKNTRAVELHLLE